MNKKSTKDRAFILHCLVEGNSIRSTTRLTGASKNTVLKLLVEVGEACAAYHHEKVSLLRCKRLQLDEIWSFVYSKAKNVPEGMEDKAGDVWTWTAIDTDTKLIPSWFVGGRDADTAEDFISDLASRLVGRVQVTTDGLKSYIEPIETLLEDRVDYAMLVKKYGINPESEKRYSPNHCIGAVKQARAGTPDITHVSTSHVERQNLTMRMSMRRFTRLTNAFSKKIENHVAAISLHFMYYNFCRNHSTIKTTPAIAAKLTDKTWSLEDVINMTDDYWYDKNC
jgi:IS1 family transposase